MSRRRTRVRKPLQPREQNVEVQYSTSCKLQRLLNRRNEKKKKNVVFTRCYNVRV